MRIPTEQEVYGEDQDEDYEPTSEELDRWIEHCYGSR